MRATPGDQLIVRSRHVGEHERHGEVVEVHGTGGAPPYVVRWDPDGHEGLFFPGPDVSVQQAPAAAGTR